MRKITYSFTEVLEETENKSHVDINLGSQLEKLFSRSTDCTHNPWTRKCTHLQKHAFSYMHCSYTIHSCLCFMLTSAFRSCILMLHTQEKWVITVWKYSFMLAANINTLTTEQHKEGEALAYSPGYSPSLSRHEGRNFSHITSTVKSKNTFMILKLLLLL